MLGNVPHASERRPAPERTLAVAGSLQGRQRTVLTFVSVSAVRPNPEQPRKYFAPDKLTELAESIRTRGLLQPIVVRRTTLGYELLAGERRFRAAQLANVDRLPALVREGDDPLELALIENLQREDLSPLEEAEALATLIERHQYSHQDVADLLGKSRPYVSNTLALTRLPAAVKEELQQGGVGQVSRELLMGVARAADETDALALWRQLRVDSPSVRQFRATRDGGRRERPLVREALLAARRLNRALKRLAEGDAVDGREVATLSRVLRRSSRLIGRQLSGFGAVPG